MTAPALNPAQFASPGAAMNAGASAKGAAPLAGFQALLAALFPEGAPEAAGAPSAPATAMTSAMPAAAVIESAAPAPQGDGVVPTDTTTDRAETEAVEVAVAPDTPLPAMTAPVAQAPANEAAMTAATGETEDTSANMPPEASPLRRDARRHIPAEHRPDRLAHAVTGTADGPEAAGVEATASDGEGEVADTEPPHPRADLPKLPESAARPAQPPAWGTHKIAGAPAAPALENANAQADLAGKVQPIADETAKPESPAPATPPASTASEPTDVAAAAAATVAQPPKAPPAAPPTGGAKGAKVDRSKAGSEATPDAIARPVEAADKPVHAKPAAGAGAPDPVDAVETKAPEPRQAGDAADATLQSEARAAETSAAPASESSRQVRGAPETVANLAAQIVKKLEARTTRFDVELDPHGLGKVDVRIEIHAHGRITAAMTFDNPQAAQDVKARAAELQRALEQAGFDLSGSALSFDVAQDHGRGQGRAWQDQNDNGSAFRGQAFRAALETAGDAAEAANQGALRLRRGVDSGLDLRI
jgi:flagellar hook-length control protein FliK